VRSAIYQPTNAIAAALWAAGLGFGGYFVGPPVVDLVDDLGTAAAVALGVLVAGTVGLALWQRRRRSRAGDGGAPR